MLLFPKHKPNYVLTKPCVWCYEEKPLSAFPKHIRLKNEIDTRCRDCIKIHSKITTRLKKEAPPKPEVCDCCGKKPKRWYLDHDHKTHLFRGWICASCNNGIGSLGDNIEGVLKALKYLIKHEFKLDNVDVLQKIIDYLTKKEVMS
jgi:hypothetical protein